jgi:hypothetical protein
MPDIITDALDRLGVNTPGVSSFGQAIDQFNLQNLSPIDLSGVSKAIKDSVTTNLPNVLRAPQTAGAIDFKPAKGEWTSVHYADDLIAHAPKFKFLFKVSFIGFGSQEFQYFVHRCDKPKVQMNHQDVNYYNFRTRVLTSVIFQPIAMSLLDETGNTVNSFFTTYLATVSGTGSGGWGTNKGFGPGSSTKPYEKNGGYSVGKRVIIEQIFANGISSNIFELINPRIESFDFDELSMEDSSSGSMLNLSLSYDALESKTVSRNDSYTWGKTDLRKGGGSSGLSNGGSSSLYDGGVPSIQAAGGSGIEGLSPITKPSAFFEETIGSALRKSLPSLDIFPDPVRLIASIKNRVSSAADITSRNVAESFAAVTSFSFVPPAPNPVAAAADVQVSDTPIITTATA